MDPEKYKLAMLCLDKIEAALDKIAQHHGYASAQDLVDKQQAMKATLPMAA